MSSLSMLASLGMAFGAPLVYADQAYSIYRKQDSRGFSHDVCAVLLIANITRCFFWLGEHFEFALLLQSVLMIFSQLGLLYLCLRFKPITSTSRSISSDGSRVVFAVDEDEEIDQDSHHQPLATSRQDVPAQNQQVNNNDDQDELGYPNKQPLLVTLGLQPGGGGGGYERVTDPSQPSQQQQSNGWFASIKSGNRPLNFWQWEDYTSYLVFLGFYSLVFAILEFPLGKNSTFIAVLGYLALGLESTLPIPQLITNQRRKSLAGFRTSVLFGWVAGDSFKLIYFIIRSSPLQFTVCAIFQLSIDFMILLQSYLFRHNTARDMELQKQRQEEQRIVNDQQDIEDVEANHHRHSNQIESDV